MSTAEGPRALDATLWDEPTTGIGLYTRELADAMERLGATPLRLGARASGDAPRGALGRSLWTVRVLPKLLAERGVRLYHAHGNFNLPLRKAGATRFLLTVHDIIPDLFPGTVSRAYRWQFKLWLRRSLRLSDRVVCVSEATRRDLLARYGFPPERAHVVHNGVDHVLRVPALSPAEEAQLRALGLPGGFVLFAGSWDVRKNVRGVLEAWRRLPKGARVPLVLVGQPWFGSGEAEREVGALKGAGYDVRPLGFQPASVLYALMRRATAFVFPSLYEGFGLPPLEAMRLGTAAVVSNRGSLPEVCGEAALAVDPDEPGQLARAIERLLTRPSEREARRHAGEAWASAFTWERAARETLHVYAMAESPL